MTKAETKAVAAVVLSPMMKQFLDLVTSMRPTSRMPGKHHRFWVLL